MGVIARGQITVHIAEKGDKGDQGERGLQGLQGFQGLQGIPGANGANGATTYFHIKYGPVANPTAAQMSEIPNTFIGTYVDTTAADSTDPVKYTWARFQGLQGVNGEKGIPGTNGANGQTSYLHIKYSDNGTGFTANNGETPGAYIGQYTDFTEADSSVFSKYNWTKIKGDQGELGEMISGGKMLYRDPEFREGLNGVYIYNNAENGTVSVNRITKPNDCPTTSTHCMEIRTTGVAEPGHGGFYQPINSRANAVFIQKIVAKLPVGYYLVNHANSQGDGASDTFITPTAGTGRYETYLRKVVCGTSGTFGSGGYIALHGGVAPVTWHVASCTVYDMSDSEKYDQAITSAQQAAEAYAKAKFELAETTAKAYADGVVDAEEARAIADATSKAERAKNEAILTAAMDATDKISEIEIGGKNLIQNSLINETSSEYGFAFRAVDVQAGKQYVFSAEGYIDHQALADRKGLAVFIYRDNWSFSQSFVLTTLTPLRGFAIFTATANETLYINSYLYPSDEPRIGKATVNWYMLQEGNKATAWKPAEEDIIIAGENILRQRHEIITTGADYPNETTYSTQLINGIRETTITSATSNNNAAPYRYQFIAYYVTRNIEAEEYIFSFDYKTNCSGGNISVDIRDAANGNLIRAVVRLENTWGKWKRGYCVADWRGKQSYHVGILFQVYTNNANSGNYVAYRNLKLAKGNRGYEDSPSPEDIQAAAVEDSAKNLGLTKIEGGLIWTNLVKLQRIGGQETAGISGIDKNSQGQTLPAFWAGGTYSQALNRQANVDIYHNGKSKLGRLFVNEDGSTVYKDTSNVERIYITPEKISALADLTGSSQTETGVNTNNYSKTIILNTFNTNVLLGTIYIGKNSSDLIIKNIAISTSIQNNVTIGSAEANIRLYVQKDGAMFAWIDSVGVSYYGKDESAINPSSSKTIDTSFKVPAGNYQLYAEVSLSSTSDLIDASCYISSGRFTWQYIANISKSELGQNGMLSFRDINNYIYAAIESNLLNFVVKTDGKWDTPGVLVAYSVLYNGSITTRWGGKVYTTGNATKGGTGTYNVPHNIGHTNYIVTANVVNSSGTNICMIAQKNNNSVRIVIRDLASDLSDQNFDIIITGNNA